MKLILTLAGLLGLTSVWAADNIEQAETSVPVQKRSTPASTPQETPSE
jgi:hypothetical protein